MKYTQSTPKKSYVRAIKSSLVGVFAFVMLFSGMVAHANITPVMTAGWVIGSSNPNLIQISVTGDPYSNVILYYTRSGYGGTQSLALGQINASGYYTTTLDNTTYNIPANSAVYVTTTINGYTLTSPSISWPIGTGGNSSITFSPNTINNLQWGQTVSVNIYGGSGQYTVTGNSLSNIVQATVNGSVLTVSMSSYYGGTIPLLPNASAIITVCSNNTTSCGTLTVTVGNNNSSSLYFNQSNPTVAPGQTINVTVSGGPISSYVISSNTNSNIANAVISGNTIIITGVNVGTSSLIVCSATSYGINNVCSTLPITVSYGGTTGGITLSQTNLSLAIGQTNNISVSGTTLGNYYISSNTNQSVASATLSGSIVTVYGLSAGSTNVTICQYSGQCAVLYVTVGGSGPSIGSRFLTFNTPNPVLTINQSTTVYVTGGQGIYTIPYNSSSSVVQTSINGNTLVLTGRQNGFAVVVVCDSYNNCGAVNIQVGSGTIIPVPTPGFIFTQFMTVGSYGNEVTQLQIRLTAAGLYAGSINGIFGTLTQTAVQRYQSAHGLFPDGVVGPMTRAALNNGL